MCSKLNTSFSDGIRISRFCLGLRLKESKSRTILYFFKTAEINPIWLLMLFEEYLTELLFIKRCNNFSSIFLIGIWFISSVSFLIIYLYPLIVDGERIFSLSAI